jgi:hypothetical protein
MSISVDGKPFQTIMASHLFKPPKTIILQTGKEFLIGNIESLLVFDGLIYILDSFIAKGVFVFNMDGKFIGKIGSLGKGPGEYTNISDFTIDTVNQELYLLANQRIHKYTADGTFIKTIFVQNLHKHLYHIQYYNGHLYADAVPHSNQNDEMLLKIDVSNGKILNQYLSSSEYNYSWNKLFKMETSSFKARLSDPPRYAQTFMHQIISLDDIQPYIELKTERTATKEDVDFCKKNGSSLFQFSKMHTIHNYVEGNSFIFFNFYNNGYYGILHRIHENLTTVGFLKNDLVYKDIHDKGTKFQFSNNKGAYSIIEMDSFLDDFEKKYLVENLDKIDQLDQLDENSNPIIFYYEYKNL